LDGEANPEKETDMIGIVCCWSGKRIQKLGKRIQKLGKRIQARKRRRKRRQSQESDTNWVPSTTEIRCIEKGTIWSSPAVEEWIVEGIEEDLWGVRPVEEDGGPGSVL
jgi:hypothetical protein